MTFGSFAAPFAPELVLLAGALLVFLLDVVKVRRIEAVGGVAVAATAVSYTHLTLPTTERV